jgi:hypothetical protein
MTTASGVGVEYQPISWFSAAPPPGLSLGYAAYTPEPPGPATRRNHHSPHRELSSPHSGEGSSGNGAR